MYSSHVGKVEKPWVILVNFRPFIDNGMFYHHQGIARAQYNDGSECGPCGMSFCFRYFCVMEFLVLEVVFCLLLDLLAIFELAS